MQIRVIPWQLKTSIKWSVTYWMSLLNIPPPCDSCLHLPGLWYLLMVAQSHPTERRWYSNLAAVHTCSWHKDHNNAYVAASNENVSKWKNKILWLCLVTLTTGGYIDTMKHVYVAKMSVKFSDINRELLVCILLPLLRYEFAKFELPMMEGTSQTKALSEYF